MASAPRVSVIVPFYESAQTLDACLRSLLEQEDIADGYEVILIDNRSPDGSPEIARRHADRDDRIVILEESTPGAYAARNTGIDRARGEVIAFTDADCVVAPDWLRSILAGLDDPQTAVLVGRCRYPKQASRALRALGAYENAKTATVLAQPDPAYRFAYCNNMAVRAEVFTAIGSFEAWPRAADTELIHRLAARLPDRRVVFWPSMTITHLEFLRARDRLRRLRRYTGTNAGIDTFRELGTVRRLGVVAQVIRSLFRAENP